VRKKRNKRNIITQAKKYASASHATEASGLLFFTQRTQAPANRNARSRQQVMVANAIALALRAFEWKPGLSDTGITQVVCSGIKVGFHYPS